MQQLLNPVFLPRAVDIGDLVLWEAAEKLVDLGGRGGWEKKFRPQSERECSGMVDVYFSEKIKVIRKELLTSSISPSSRLDHFHYLPKTCREFPHVLTPLFPPAATSLFFFPLQKKFLKRDVCTHCLHFFSSSSLQTTLQLAFSAPSVPALPLTLFLSWSSMTYTLLKLLFRSQSSSNLTHQ